MNNQLKKVVECVLNNDLDKAKKYCFEFPDNYAAQLLTPQNHLSEFGIWQSVDYPFPRKLYNLLADCYSNQINTAILTEHFKNYTDTFQLIDNCSKELSEFARIKAIQGMTLARQCETLGISYETLELTKRAQKVEENVADYFTQLGYISKITEGKDFLVLMRCAAWEGLSRFCKSNNSPYLEAILYHSPSSSKKGDCPSRALIDGIKKATLKSIKRNFINIYPNTILEETYPGLVADEIADLFMTLGKDKLLEIAKMFIEDPYKFRKGWPDLTMFTFKKRIFSANETKLFLREVKIKDKLLPSQIMTISRIKSIIKDIGVIQIKYT